MKEHQHTRVVNMASEKVKSMLAGVDDGPTFMDTSVSPKTQARRDRIASASPDIQALQGHGFTQEFLDRLARLDKGDA